MINDADQVEVGELPIGTVEYPDNTYDYDTITRRSRRRGSGELYQIVQRGLGPHIRKV